MSAPEKKDPGAKLHERLPAQWQQDLGPVGSEKKWFVRKVQNTQTGEVVVAKYFNGGNPVRRQRFYREATEVARFGPLPGVLPVLLLDEKTPGEPNWYLIPEATMLRPHLNEATDLRVIVQAFADLAHTLALLASAKIYHRDIKPDNLFWFNGQAVLADFGIAYWDGAQITEKVEKIGPMGFIAPEMYAVGGSDRTEIGENADVYSLAQTLFVVARRRGDFPPGGTQWSTVEEFELKVWNRTPAIDALRLILEAATRFEPGDRLEMRHLAAELASWLVLYPDPIPRSPRTTPFQRGWGTGFEELRRAEKPTKEVLGSALGDLTRPTGSLDWKALEGGGVRLGSYPWEPDDPEQDADGYAIQFGAVDESAGLRVILGAAFTLLDVPETTPFAEVHHRQDDGRWSLHWQTTGAAWSRAGLPAALCNVQTAAREAAAHLHLS
ncbi:protein kinase domain-containing protein [Kitasatospora indigofera]|uniref:protein kinase domain-containing protein n=1 Tax=Kitasatospora indigofera TaxID=67307 RepID=UPI00368DB51F